MTEIRFTVIDREEPRKQSVAEKGIPCTARHCCTRLNRLTEENEQLKKELLFFYDVANCECSTNWEGDMEKGCKRFFNCTYEEAKEKYGDYDGMWWELND